MSEEWGPWIEHDGRGRPRVGEIVHRVYANGAEWVAPMGQIAINLGRPWDGQAFASSWIWEKPGRAVPVVRYRIRKPRGLTILEEIAKGIREPVDA